MGIKKVYNIVVGKTLGRHQLGVPGWGDKVKALFAILRMCLMIEILGGVRPCRWVPNIPSCVKACHLIPNIQNYGGLSLCS
jgi:hypothetical protein